MNGEAKQGHRSRTWSGSSVARTTVTAPGASKGSGTRSRTLSLKRCAKKEYKEVGSLNEARRPLEEEVNFTGVQELGGEGRARGQLAEKEEKQIAKREHQHLVRAQVRKARAHCKGQTAASAAAHRELRDGGR